MFADARCSAGLARWREADNVPTFKPTEEAMPYRAMALEAASLLFATQADAAKNLNTSGSNIYRAGSTTSGGGPMLPSRRLSIAANRTTSAWAVEVVARARTATL
jgi:hypothetical protein